MSVTTLYPVKDVMINSFKPDRRHGSDSLEVGDHPGGVVRSFVGFDVSSAPVSSVVSKVTLCMFVRDSARFYDTPGFISRITGVWSESGATWNNSHNITTSGTVLDVSFAHAGYDPIWDCQDVTTLYKEAKDAGGVCDLLLATTELMQRRRYRGNEFDSREARVFPDVPPYTVQKPYLLIEYVKAPELTLSGIGTIRRHGSKFYLQGEIRNIKETDEICLMYSRPGSAALLNLPGDLLPQTYLTGTSGTYNLESGGKYFEFSASGYYIFELWRVAASCETRTEKVAEYFLRLEAPTYQYQLYFDLDAPEIADSRHLLQAEYDMFNEARPWTVVPEGVDCFERLQPSTLYAGGSFETGWLCQAGEFLASGCSPLPWWMCPSLTDWDIYMRGECSCSDFKENLQPLGIPCMHLIAAKEYYGDKTPYCPYVQCG